MNRHRLMLAGGTVIAVAAGMQRRRRRPSRTYSVAPVAAATVAAFVHGMTSPQFGYSVDWGSVWGGIWGFLTGITSDVKNFVQEAIQKAVDVVTGFINTVDDVYHAITGVLTEGLAYAYNTARDVANAIIQVTVNTVNMVDQTFANFRDQLKAFLEHAWDDLKDWVLGPIGDGIKAALGEFWDVLVALKNIGADGLSFLINLIDDPINFVWHLIETLVGDAIDAALAAFDFGGDVLSRIWHILEWLAVHADDLTIDVLDKAWGVFKWFITHLDDVTVDVLDGFLHSGGSSLAAQALDAADGEPSVLSDAMEKLLGLV